MDIVLTKSERTKVQRLLQRAVAAQKKVWNLQGEIEGVYIIHGKKFGQMVLGTIVVRLVMDDSAVPTTVVDELSKQAIVPGFLALGGEGPRRAGSGNQRDRSQRRT